MVISRPWIWLRWMPGFFKMIGDDTCTGGNIQNDVLRLYGCGCKEQIYKSVNNSTPKTGSIPNQPPAHTGEPFRKKLR